MTVPKILRIHDVCVHTGLSRTAMYRLIRHGRFPKPIRLTTRTSGWVADEVSAWLAQRVSESRGGSTASSGGAT
jgi:prophage regulatory protein